METKYRELNRELIEQCISGSEKARYRLYSLYSGSMYNICLRLLNVREDAEDALQDSFAEVFNKLDSFRFESSFGAWVKRIVVNKCINYWKKKKVKLILNEERYDAISPDEIDYEEINFEVEKIRKAIEQLPDGYRLILNLYLFEGYDHTEIAEILNISESTSKTQYHRAKLRIRNILKMNSDG